VALDIDKLQSLMTESAGDIAVRYADNPARFVREMEALITRGHTAATIAAIGDRTRIMPKGLSRAERQDLQASIRGQRPYLEGFARDMAAGGMTEEQIRRRAELYAGPIRLTYSKGRWPNAPDWPGSGGTSCLAWCRCVWLERDGQLYWTLGASEHCPECLTRASNWAPYTG
jgi:hypothetical protein